MERRSLLSLLIEAADLACSMQKGIAADYKADRSLVTQADLQVGTLIRQRLPLVLGHPCLVFDEEEIDAQQTSPATYFAQLNQPIWFVDPIAGTTAYAAGLPFYAISIGRLNNGVPDIGAVCLPALGEFYIACDGCAYRYTRNVSGQLVEELMPRLPTMFNKDRPLATHSSPTLFAQYALCQAGGLPLASLPAVNIGLLWTALGYYCACLICLKVWDFAGSWAILRAVGAELMDAETGVCLSAIDPSVIDDQWKLHTAHLAVVPEVYGQLRPMLEKKNG